LPMYQKEPLCANLICFDLGFDMGANYLEFDYAGRDTNRKVVRLLSILAPIIGNAQGEAQCKLNWEESDATFEFYAIRNHQLTCQRGYIVREAEEAVHNPDNLRMQEEAPTAA
ncbi:MAG: hypothetical protein WKF30_16290, partial [Pyrinomonadaceae bacterium]